MNSMTIENIYNGYHRLKTDRQNRSDAINNAIIERDRTIKRLRAELRIARCCMAVVLLVLAVANGYEIWRLWL
jgi:hypothetical protein